MTFLFLSIDGLTDPLGQSQILPYLCALSKQGFVIKIASVEKKTLFQKNESVVRDIVNEANIDWHYVFYDKKIPFYSQFKNFRALKKLAASIIQSNKSSYFIHCRSYLPALIGLNYKRKYGYRFLFDMRGFWADERAEAGTWNLKSPHQRFLYSYFKRKEAEFYNECDHMVSLTQNAKSDILNRFPKIRSDKISVIPCCADLNFFDYRKIKSETVTNTLVYLGSLGTLYMLNEMLECYSVYRKYFSNPEFLILSPDFHFDLKNLLIQNAIPENEVKLQYAKRNEVPALIGNCKAAIYFIRPSYSKKASSPTKCAELLGMGIPIISNSGIGDSDAIFENNNCGYLIKSFNAEEYQKACLHIANTEFNKADLNQIASNYFSLEDGVKKYAEIYLALSHE